MLLHYILLPRICMYFHCQSLLLDGETNLYVEFDQHCSLVRYRLLFCATPHLLIRAERLKFTNLLQMHFYSIVSQKRSCNSTIGTTFFRSNFRWLALERYTKLCMFQAVRYSRALYSVCDGDIGPWWKWRKKGVNEELASGRWALSKGQRWVAVPVSIGTMRWTFRRWSCSTQRTRATSPRWAMAWSGYYCSYRSSADNLRMKDLLMHTVAQVGELLRMGVNIDSYDDDHVTALQIAAFNGNNAMVRKSWRGLSSEFLQSCLPVYFFWKTLPTEKASHKPWSTCM